MIMDNKSTSKPLKILTEIAIAACLYYLTARLGFLIALPPGNVTALWPPSGLAILAILTSGTHTSLGIFIGSFVVNWQMMSGSAALTVAAAIAAGSTLQAWVIVYLLRRFVKTLPPETIQQTILAISLTVAGTLLAASVGVTSLSLAGIARWDNFSRLIITWWLGDLTGILVFAPTPFILWVIRRGRQVSEPFLWPLTCFIIGISLFTYLVTDNTERQKLISSLENDTHELAQALQTTINQEILSLTAIRAFYDSSETVTPQEFAIFTTPLLNSSPAAAGFEWIPRISLADRPAFEQAIRAQGYEDFSIYEKDAQGNHQPADSRAEYFPVTLIEPFAPNKAAFGFDLASNPTRLATITQARDSGKPAATASIHLVQDTGSQTGILIIMPVYRHGMPIDTIEERRANLIGLTLGVFRVNDLVNHALANMKAHNIEVYVYDINYPGAATFMSFHPSQSGEQTISTQPALSELEVGVFKTGALNVGGRTWLIVTRPGPGYNRSVESWIPWASLFMGVGVAGVFLAFVNHQQQVKEVLRKKDAEYSLVSENSKDITWILDVETMRFSYVSPPVGRMLGYSLQEMSQLTAADFLRAEDLPQIMAEISARTEAQKTHGHSEPYIGEIEQRRKDGTYITTEISAAIVTNAAGKFQAVGTTSDITERKHAALLQNTVYKIAESAQVAETLQKLYEQIHLEISRVMYAKNFYIALYDETSNLLNCVYSVDEKISSRDPNPPTRGLTAHVLRTGKSLLFHANQPIPEVELLGETCSVWLGVPLIAQNKTIGVMAVQHYNDDQAYTGHEQRILEFVSSQVATAIDRKRAEEMLRNSQASLEMAQAIAHLGNWEINIQTGSVSWSKEMFNLLRRDPALGTPSNAAFLESIHPDDQQIINEMGKRANETGQPATIEFRFNKDSEPTRYFQLTIYPIKNENGQTARISGTLLDITEIKTTQLELEQLNRDLEKRVEERTAEMRRSEATYRALFENSNDGIFLYSTSGQELSANQQAFNIIGYSQEEYKILTDTIQNPLIIQPEERDDSDARFEAVLRGEHVPLYERTITRKDGQKIDVEVNLSAVRDPNGNVILVQSVVRNITERKKAEEALRESRDKLRAANAALEKASRAKTEFLANMSHELRTPLNGILGLSEILLDSYRGPLNEAQRKYIINIDASGRHLLSLINDILDLSKVEAGKLELHLEKIDINEICMASLAFIKEPGHKKGIRIEFRPDKRLSNMMADPLRMKQMLVNLLSNAIKFTPSGGKISLEVHANLEQNHIEFSVSDTGVGISAEDLQRLFTPFTQIDSSLTRQHEGTGLGLVLVKNLAELHGGGISVTSAIGQGSRFTIFLPWLHNQYIQNMLVEIDPNSRDNYLTHNTPARPGTVLLVEDSETNIITINEYLERIGYQVIIARNGQEAISIAEESSPDIILMDIQLPVMDGLEATRQLRNNPRFASTPIIALTALAMPGDRERCLAAGANEYISKPVSLKQLGNAISKLLENVKE